MPEKIEFVQIESNEDATSVRDRLSFLRGQQVLVIWPEEGTALTRKLDLVLIQREAMRRAIRLALVTHDQEVIEHAKELDISTFETIGASQRGRWKRGRGKVFTSRFQKPKDEPQPEELMPVASRVRVEQRVSASALVRGLIVLVLLAAAGLLAYLLIPGAIVTLDLAEQPLQVEVALTASPVVTITDVENGVIPARARKIEIEEVGTRPTSGLQTLTPLAAQGLVTFINQSDTPIDIPAGTVVSTSAGAPVRFQTTEDAVLSAGLDQIAEVEIEALPDSTGDAGNIEAGLINNVESDWSDRVIVTNRVPVTGGETRVLPSVTQEDRDRLLRAVKQQLQARALSEFESLVDEHEIIITETITIVEEREDWTTFSADVGAVTDSLNLTLRTIVQVITIDERRGEEVLFARMSEQVPPKRFIQPESLEYSRGPVTDIDAEGLVTFSMSGSGLVTGEVNTGILQERLAGRTLKDAQAYLATTVDLEAGTAPTIALSPNWGGRLPLLSVRISIQVVE